MLGRRKSIDDRGAENEGVGLIVNDLSGLREGLKCQYLNVSGHDRRASALSRSSNHLQSEILKKIYIEGGRSFHGKLYEKVKKRSPAL